MISVTLTAKYSTWAGCDFSCSPGEDEMFPLLLLALPHVSLTQVSWLLHGQHEPGCHPRARRTLPVPSLPPQPACPALRSVVFPCAQQHHGSFLGSEDVLAFKFSDQMHLCERAKMAPSGLGGQVELALSRAAQTAGGLKWL